MDSFTERILERARERQRKLQLQNITDDKKISSQDVSPVSSKPLLANNLNDDKSIEVKASSESKKSTENINSKLPRQNSVTRISSDLPGSPQPQLKTLNIQKENFNMEIKLSSSENMRVEVEIEERDEDEFQHEQNTVAIEQTHGSSDTPSLREDTKKRLQRLGKLFAGGDELDISSPIHRTEEKFLSEEINENKENSEAKPPRKGLGKLAALASNINQWEDDITPHKKVEKCVSPSKKVITFKPKVTEMSPNFSKKAEVNSVTESGKSNVKSVNWDQKVLKSLESQGFTRTQSNSKLVYKYGDSQWQKNKPFDSNSKITCIPEKVIEPKKVENEMTPRSPKKLASTLSASMANKTAIFESSPKNTKDPALLSVSERKALFERNKGAAPPVPKFLGAQLKNSNVTQNKLPNKNNKADSTIDLRKVEDGDKNEKKNVVQNVVKNTPTSPKKVEPKAEGIARTMAALLESKTTISQQQIENSVKEQRQKEMELLLNRFQNKNNKDVIEEIEKEEEEEEEKRTGEICDSEYESEEEVNEKTAMIKDQKKTQIVKRPNITPPPPPPPVPLISPNRQSPNKRTSVGDSPKVAAVLEDVKRIKVAPPKDGRLYPCLSDIETETEPQTASPTPNNSYEEQASDSGSEINTSFGRDLLKQVYSHETPLKRHIYDESTESDISDILNDMDDDYIDEVKNYKNGPTPPKQGRSISPEPNNKNFAQPSNSFNYKSFSPKKQQNVNSPRKESTNMPTHVVDGDSVLPLTHTISIYRKQMQTCVTPVRQVTRQPLLEESETAADTMEEGVDKKIQDLLDEVSKQQTVISQTSQALNLCYSTPEFTGSTEQVEAEKVLLVATHRRQAALHEIQRLKVEGTLRPKTNRSLGFHVEKGTLTISNVSLPLKREYARALAAAGGKGHHVICLVKCDEQVVPTQLVSTVAGSLKNLELELNIPGAIVLENVRGDFTLTFEVYCLQAQEEILPHEIKYHINKKQGKITPKKPKGENRMIKPPKESPGGPLAVRSPTFALIGYVVLAVQAINKKQWTLNKTPSMSPLEGSVQMSISYKPQMTVKHKGFLTMFDDVSGFGAWHRRWCKLEEGTLVYWKYPDDEKKKLPIASIDLSNCVTEKVGPVSREICARLNTFLIEIERDSQPYDKESLVTVRKGNKTIIRHLLSADTKEERIEWCDAFNKALAALRLSLRV